MIYVIFGTFEIHNMLNAIFGIVKASQMNVIETKEKSELAKICVLYIYAKKIIPC